MMRGEVTETGFSCFTSHHLQLQHWSHTLKDSDHIETHRVDSLTPCVICQLVDAHCPNPQADNIGKEIKCLLAWLPVIASSAC